MSELSISALSVAELSRFAEPVKREMSVVEKYDERQEFDPKACSQTAEGVGSKVDIAA